MTPHLEVGPMTLRLFRQGLLLDQGANGMSNEEDEERTSKPSAEEQAEALQNDIDRTRGNLDVMLNELDRRRRRLFNLPEQLSRHAIALAIIGVGLLGAVTGSWALAVRRRRRRDTIGARITRLRQAVARMVDAPERVARSPSPSAKIATAGATALASVVAKRLAERALRGRSFGGERS
jgi:hypothetical protein